MGQAKLKAARAATAPARGRQVLSACVFQAEVTTYNAEGEVAARPKLIGFAFLEAGIPASVRAWLLERALFAIANPPPPEPENGK